jgi:hypothetical protein
MWEYAADWDAPKVMQRRAALHELIARAENTDQ